MRSPDVYQRSAPRARRAVEHEAGADYGPAARVTVATVPALLREAEAARAVALARNLGQALSEAEGIVKRGTAPVLDDTEMTADALEPTKAEQVVVV